MRKKPELRSSSMALIYPYDEDLNLSAVRGQYGTVTKSKASAHPPQKDMKSSVPTAPTRFSAAKKASHHDEAHHCHYAVHGAWLCHTGRVRRVNEDSLLAGSKSFMGSTERPEKI